MRTRRRKVRRPWVSTVNGIRRLRDNVDVVHAVNMKHRTGNKRGETLCGQQSWKINGEWTEPDQNITCLICLGAMP